MLFRFSFFFSISIFVTALAAFAENNNNNKRKTNEKGYFNVISSLSPIFMRAKGKNRI